MKSDLRIVEELTSSEVIFLKSQIIGYGNLAKASRETKIHPKTIRRISISGRGIKKHIQLIRNHLLAQYKNDSVENKIKLLKVIEGIGYESGERDERRNYIGNEIQEIGNYSQQNREDAYG